MKLLERLPEMPEYPEDISLSWYLEREHVPGLGFCTFLCTLDLWWMTMEVMWRFRMFFSRGDLQLVLA